MATFASLYAPAFPSPALAMFASLCAIAYFPSSPPPSAPLPELPLEATAGTTTTTPRNENDLYAEFSRPGLGIAELISQLEDLAEAEENMMTTLFQPAKVISLMETIASESSIGYDMYSTPRPKLFYLVGKLQDRFDRTKPEWLPGNEEELKEHLEAIADYHQW
ncbi:MAG: hypothetical protein Q9170_007595 [Blastenia crenularia]